MKTQRQRFASAVTFTGGLIIGQSTTELVSIGFIVKTFLLIVVVPELIEALQASRKVLHSLGRIEAVAEIERIDAILERVRGGK